MRHYPVAHADAEVEGCACAIIKQLEDRDQDPITILVGDGPGAAPTPFHRRRHLTPEGAWFWEAEDDRGHLVRSGVVHHEPSAPELSPEDELALACFPD